MDRYRATLDGGFPLGKATNLVDTCARARQHVHAGKRVWIRQTGDPKQRVIEVVPTNEGGRLNVYNSVGEPTEAIPDWIDKASRLLRRT